MSWDIDCSSLNDIFPLKGNVITATYRDIPVEGGLTKPLRICQAIGLARRTIININGPSNLCSGDYNCGFKPVLLPEDIEQTVKQRYKYISMAVARKANSRRASVPYNLAKYLVLAPLEKTDFRPDLVIFTCLPVQAHDLIHISIYDSGDIRIGTIQNNLCRSAITDPFLTGEIQIGLIDHGGRKYGNYKPEEIIVSMPTKWFLTILHNYQEIKKLLQPGQALWA